MQKIISLFKRDYDGDRLVFNEIVPGAEWVVDGEGMATRKWDGSCCAIVDGVFYKRYDAKKGKTPPVDFTPAQPDPDPNTGHWPGWVPVKESEKADKWFRRAYHNTSGEKLPNGTYEAVGPHFQGNPEMFQDDYLMKHGEGEFPNAPREFEPLMAFFMAHNIEGLVWHHPDGRMVKIKAKDFGISRNKTFTREERKKMGCYFKFHVARTDGRDLYPGDKHYGCDYFVLDLTHDPFAYQAIHAYADACKDEYPLLAFDLYEKARKLRERLQKEAGSNV